MKYLHVALIGLLWLAAFTASAPTDAGDQGDQVEPARYHDSEGMTFRCVDGNVRECSVIDCSVKEFCEHGYESMTSPSADVVGAYCKPASILAGRDEPDLVHTLDGSLDSGPFYEPRLNDQTKSYHCEGPNVMECGISGTCYLYEACKHECIDLTSPSGAICADVPPKDTGKITKARDESHDATYAPPMYVNDGYNTYRCTPTPKQEVLGCSPTGCWTAQVCQIRCIEWENGAYCNIKHEKDWSTTPIPTLSSRELSSVTSAKGNCGDGSKACKICSDDRRGVLTCQYGFCYVKPGQWCARNASCRDGCNCCKKDKKRTKKDTIGQGIKKVESVCVPGHIRCDPDHDEILQRCDDNGHWLFSETCCRTSLGASCCFSGPSPGPNGAKCSCDGLPSIPHIPSYSMPLPVPTQSVQKPEKRTARIEKTVSILRAKKEISIPTARCTPGHLMCDKFHYEWLLFCNDYGQWEMGEFCGATSENFGCCQGNALPGYKAARCTCEGLPGIPPVILQPVTCVPRKRKCDPTLEMIMECSSRDGWQIMKVCGRSIIGHGCCMGGQEPGFGAFYCGCPPGREMSPKALLGRGEDTTSISHMLETAATEFSQTPQYQPASLAADTFCIPGQRKCDDIISDRIIYCNPFGKWQLLELCGTTSKGFGCCQGRNTPTFESVECNCNISPRNAPQPASDPPQLQRDVSEAPANAPDLNCHPGTYQCDPTRRYITICGADRRLHISADCGFEGACYWERYSMPFCWSGQAAVAPTRAVEARGAVSASGAMNLVSCQPGIYTCDGNKRWLRVCGSDGYFHVSADCGWDGSCYETEHGEAFCDSRK